MTANSDWGGEGCIGCGIGYGYLHRIPVRSSLAPPAPMSSSLPITQPLPINEVDSLPEVPLVVPSTPGHDEVVNGSGVEIVDQPAISSPHNVVVSMVPATTSDQAMPGVSIGYSLPVQPLLTTSVETITSAVASVSIQSVPSITLHSSLEASAPPINFLSSSPPKINLGDPTMTN